jgi:hypothetical protein
MKFELKKLGSDGFMLNYFIEDSITGKSIYGIWTADKVIEKVWQHLEGYLLGQGQKSLSKCDFCLRKNIKFKDDAFCKSSNGF